MPDVLFNNARGAASSLQMTPPFAFSDVTMSVFPLRASLPSLDNFCRNYLNQAPALVQFRPFIPFVYLVILDYGRMSLEAANMGWVSQREVAFGIPLRWLVGGETGPQFHDWAFSSPFIFVDNELSMSTGREVYGWPKLLARLDPSVSEWVRDPHGARRVFQVSTKGTTEAYTGKTSEYRPLLSVYQHRTAGLLDMPPSLDAVLKPLSQASGAMASMTRLSMDLTKTFLGMASDRITGSAVLPDMADQDTFRAQLAPDRLKAWTNTRNWSPGVQDTLWSFFPRMYANTINFKQFRDAANPHATCYQAITAARMPVRSFKQGGFLGPQNMMLGQLDGGFRIDIHHLAGLPIVESLGLEVAEERESNGSFVSSLAPVAPLWLQVDMTYGTADTLAWRGREGDWEEGAVLKAARKTAQKRRGTKPAKNPQTDAQTTPLRRLEPGTAAETPEDVDDPQNFDYVRAMNFFNTARGASEAVGGSFTVPDASVRVLPIKADARTLNNFVSSYLRVEKHMRFEAWGDFVYLVISDFKQMNSELSSIAKRRARELSLMVPVKCYDWYTDDAYPESGGFDPVEDQKTRERRGREKLVTTGFVSAFSYVDDVETAITSNEVFGVPSMGSTITASENEWLSFDFSAAREHREILAMKAQVLPALMVGAKAVDRTLVELSSHSPTKTDVRETQEESVSRWVGLLADDLERKHSENASAAGYTDPDEVDGVSAALGFGLKLLGGDLAVNQFALKQFRDSTNSLNACYQGLVLRRHKILKLGDVREIEGPLHVSITDYPTQPITEILGMKPKFSFPGRDRIVRVFEPLRAFSLNADLHRGKGSTLFERAGTEKWSAVDSTEQMFGWKALDGNEVTDLIRNADDHAPVDLVYRFKRPDGPATRQKGPARAEKRDITRWLSFWADRGLLTHAMTKQRDRPDRISVLSNMDVIDKFTVAGAIDISAWNAQVKTRETTFRQSDLAETLETFAPATVLDRMLSRQWGLSATTPREKFFRSDFCIPISSVPPDLAGRLFPETERMGAYWPLPETYAQHLETRRIDEATAFTAQLRSVCRMVAMAYPGQLMQAEQTPIDEQWTIDRSMKWLAEQLDAMVVEPLSTPLAERLRKLLGSIDNHDDNYEVMKAVEDMVLHFIDVHLPDSFKRFRERSQMEAFFASEYSIPPIPADDWKNLCAALSEVTEKLCERISEDYIAEDLAKLMKPVVLRAHENHERAASAEAAQEQTETLTMQDTATGDYATALSNPHLLLRRRLSDMMTAGVFGEETSLY